MQQQQYRSHEYASVPVGFIDHEQEDHEMEKTDTFGQLQD
jgi:hypothetical protein